MNNFTILAKMNIECELTIRAESWEEALKQAKDLKVPDFAHPKEGDCFNDFGEFELIAIIK